MLLACFQSLRSRPTQDEVNISFMDGAETHGDNMVMLIVENTSFVKDLWISSERYSVHFDKNFVSFLPGAHRVLIKFNEPVKFSDLRVEDFKLKWL